MFLERRKKLKVKNILLWFVSRLKQQRRHIGKALSNDLNDTYRVEKGRGKGENRDNIRSFCAFVCLCMDYRLRNTKFLYIKHKIIML